jgi:hypothetical protein
MRHDDSWVGVDVRLADGKRGTTTGRVIGEGPMTGFRKGFVAVHVSVSA